MANLLCGVLWSLVYKVVEVAPEQQKGLWILSFCHWQTVSVDERFMFNVTAQLPKGSLLCPESFKWKIQDSSRVLYDLPIVSHSPLAHGFRVWVSFRLKIILMCHFFCTGRSLWPPAHEPRSSSGGGVYRRECPSWINQTPGQHAPVCEGCGVNVGRKPASYKDSTHVCHVNTQIQGRLGWISDVLEAVHSMIRAQRAVNLPICYRNQTHQQHSAIMHLQWLHFNLSSHVFFLSFFLSVCIDCTYFSLYYPNFISYFMCNT